MRLLFLSQAHGPADVPPQVIVLEPSTRAEGICLTVWAWIISALTWIGLIAFIVCGIYKTKLVIIGPIFGVVYLAYLLTMFFSPSFSYLRNRSGQTSMYDKMGEFFKKGPEIRFYAQCYHYHTYSVGSGAHNIRNSKYVTFESDYVFPYYSSRDVSGLFLLKTDKSKEKKKAFIKLELVCEVEFADAITCYDYMYHRNLFWETIRYKDMFIDFYEKRTIPGMKSRNLINISDYNPPCISCFLYVILTILTFAQVYKCYVDHYCIYQFFKIRKLVSTRYDLKGDEYSNKFSSITPQLNLFDNSYTYSDEETVCICPSIKPEPPTPDELKKAEKYQQYVANYSVKTVDGHVGVVQDMTPINTEVLPNNVSEEARLNTQDKNVEDKNPPENSVKPSVLKIGDTEEQDKKAEQ